MNKEMLEMATLAGRNKIQNQLSAVDSMDQKIGILLGFVGVIFSLMFKISVQTWVPFTLYLLGHGCLLYAFIILLFAHRGVKVDTGLNLKGYYELIKTLSKNNDVVSLLKHELAYYEKAVEENNTIINKKSNASIRATYFILIGLIFYLVGINI